MKIPQNHSQNDKTEFDVRKEELFRVLVYKVFDVSSLKTSISVLSFAGIYIYSECN